MNKHDEFLKKIVADSAIDILEELKEETQPIVIFGGGSMSYSIRKLLKSNGIKVSACWIDCAAIESLEDGIKVYSYEELEKMFSKFVVVFGHSKYEMADEISKRSAIKRCYCFVNVCYGQWAKIERQFVVEHLNEYFNTYELLDDVFSKECMIAYLNTKISEDYHYLLPVCGRNTATYFNNPFFELSDDECFIDVGAYVGDTIEEFLKTKKNYEKIVAIEPDKKSISQLKAYIANKNLSKIEVQEIGCWDENTNLSFGIDEESSSLSNSGSVTIIVKKLDDLLENERVTMIKINYLHGVYECIKGAEKILKIQKPKMMIMVGFDEWGIIRIPQLIHSINSDYKLSLRYASAMPARLILFAY